MNATLFNGVSGILTHQVGLDVTSNNISNANTVGYKANTSEFKSFIAKLSQNANSPISNDYNYGVAVAATPTDTSDGTYKSSNGEFHFAYSGRGWITVGKNSEGTFDVLNPQLTVSQQNFFTRNGQFTRDSEGYLVNSDGYYLYGINLGKIGEDGTFIGGTTYEQDIAALTGSELSPIQIPKDVYYRPNITTEINLAFNLNRGEKENNKTLANAFANMDGSVNFDAVFEQDWNSFKNGSGNTLDVAANKAFNIRVPAQVENPDFDPEQNISDSNPQYIANPNVTRFVYGDDAIDAEGNVTAQGFRTVAQLRDLLAASGLTLDVQRTDDGSGFEGSSFVISNATDTDMPIGIEGSFAKALGLTTDSYNLRAPTGNLQEDKNSRIVGSAVTVPSYGYSNDIFDEQGNKYYLRNQFYLKQAGGVGGQEEIWAVKTSIIGSNGVTNFSDAYTESELRFDGGNIIDQGPINIPFIGGNLAMNLSGVDGRQTTAFTGEASSFVDQTQDGIGAGRLQTVSFDSNGFIQLNFDNGRQEVMGRVGITAFVNDQGLKKVGGNLFSLDVQGFGGQVGMLSGPPLLGWDENSGRLKFGQVIDDMIEYSNVNIADALTELIVFQRGYSFNAKAFTTGDDLIKEAIALKR